MKANSFTQKKKNLTLSRIIYHRCRLHMIMRERKKDWHILGSGHTVEKAVKPEGDWLGIDHKEKTKN